MLAKLTAGPPESVSLGHKPKPRATMFCMASAIENAVLWCDAADLVPGSVGPYQDRDQNSEQLLRTSSHKIRQGSNPITRMGSRCPKRDRIRSVSVPPRRVCDSSMFVRDLIPLDDVSIFIRRGTPRATASCIDIRAEGTDSFREDDGVATDSIHYLSFVAQDNQG